MGRNYRINEAGEIVREDYFFRTVKGEGIQLLPSNRKVWKILLLSIVTLGIYYIVLGIAMGKETNVACKEDGEHTRGFWGAIALSIITLGIYGIVWMYKWLDREYAYLRRHDRAGILNGKWYLIYFFFIIIVMYLPAILVRAGIVSTVLEYIIVSSGCNIVQIIIGIGLMVSYVRQHNTVCRIYNDINNLVKKS